MAESRTSSRCLGGERLRIVGKRRTGVIWQEFGTVDWTIIQGTGYLTNLSSEHAIELDGR